MTFRASILTLYPDMFPGPLGHSLAGRALDEKKWICEVTHIRDFATGKHKNVDDTPTGGGAGMVLTGRRIGPCDRSMFLLKMTTEDDCS